MEHKFSVIIPTRERADTLEKTLRTISAQDYDNLEILVSDNCSTDGTRDVVATLRDPRVRYVRTSDRVSMSENWEFALSQATGEWLTIVGDDDGLLRDCVAKINALVGATRVDAITTSTCSFLWPGLTGTRSGILSVPVGKGWERRLTGRWRARVLAGTSTYPMLPMLYTGGFVSAVAVRRAKLGHGRLYHSCTPDVYSTMVLSRVMGDYVFSWEPVAISGLSRHSTGYSQFNQPARPSSPRAVDIYRQEGNIPLHSGLPVDADGQYPQSIQALVYESYLQVADLCPETRLLTPAWQLVVILATAGKHRTSVHEWGRRFAALHELDFGRAVAASRRYSLVLRARGLPATLDLMYRIHTVGSDALPLHDVYDASVAASVIQRVRPSKVRHVAAKIRARALRAMGRTPAPR